MTWMSIIPTTAHMKVERKKVYEWTTKGQVTDTGKVVKLRAVKIGTRNYRWSQEWCDEFFRELEQANRVAVCPRMRA
jgi:hypothetical protein